MGANLPASPLIASSYWFFAPERLAAAPRLPTITVFITRVATWSDGTIAPEPATPSPESETGRGHHPAAEEAPIPGPCPDV